jgi:hypothetical protein
MSYSATLSETARQTLRSQAGRRKRRYAYVELTAPQIFTGA